MKYLVTGGAGFIGNAVARFVARLGHKVVVLDDLSTGKEGNLDGIQGDVELIRASVTDADSVARCAHGADGIFHLAAVASVQKSLTDPVGCHEINVTGTLNVLEAARKKRVPRVVFSSSAAVYGEADRFPLDELEPPQPISPYGLHKLIGEQYGRLYTQSGWTDVVSLRYFNVFGPRQDPNGEYAAAVPKFITAMLSGNAPKLFGDGLQSRDFMYVNDVAHANFLAMTADNLPQHTVNICSGQETSLLDLLEALGQATGLKPEPELHPPREGDIRRSVGRPDKARKLLGLPTPGPLFETIKETVDWYKS